MQIFNDNEIYLHLRHVQPLKTRFLAFLALKPLYLDFSTITALPALLKAIYKLVKAPAGTYLLYLRNSLSLTPTPRYTRRNSIPDYLPAAELHLDIIIRALTASPLALQHLNRRRACKAFFPLTPSVLNRKQLRQAYNDRGVR